MRNLCNQLAIAKNSDCGVAFVGQTSLAFVCSRWDIWNLPQAKNITGSKRGKKKPKKRAFGPLTEI
ncbi:MAG: hypothetical protein ACRC62_13635 [Microcoleus sp.]